jgi:hypothetical protein
MDGITKRVTCLANVGSFQNEEQLATRAIIIEDDKPYSRVLLSNSLPILW